MRLVTITIFLLWQAVLVSGAELHLSIVEGTQGGAAVPNANVVIKENGATRTTTSAGTVRLPIPDGLSPDTQLTIHVDWKDWIVAEPPAGKIRVPANSSTTLEIMLLPRGSPKLLSHEHLVQLLEDAASIKRQFSKGKETDGNTELTAFVAEWSKRNGFGLEQVKAALDQWAKEVQLRSDDRFQTALAEFAQQQFGRAAMTFEQAAQDTATKRKQIDTKRAELGQESERLRKHEAEAQKRAGDSYRFERRWDRSTDSYRKSLALLDPERDSWQYLEIEDNFVATLREYAARVDEFKKKELLEEAIRNLRETDKLIREHFSWIGDSEGIIQSNLGVLLSDLGDSATESDAERYYTDALAAHLRAQEIFQKQGNQEAWAENQFSTGAVMFSLATRSPDARQQLEATAKVFRSALDVFTKRSDPLDSARARIGLGMSLAELSSYHDGPAAVKIGMEAVAALKEGLESMSSIAEAPQEWKIVAMAYLGAGMLYVGRAATEPEARLQRVAAVDISRHLARVSQDAAPVLRGFIHVLLGISLSELSDSSPPERAIPLLRESLAESKAGEAILTREAFPSYWANLTGFHGMALRRLGRLTPGAAGTQLLRDAVAKLRESVEAMPRESGPSDWAEGQTELGAALGDLGLRTSSDQAENLFLEAAEAYRLAIETATPERSPRVNRVAREGLAKLEAARKGQK